MEDDVCVECIASMRPRHRAAENVERVERPERRQHQASMRPRHRAAENGEEARLHRGLAPGFNEAAA